MEENQKKQKSNGKTLFTVALSLFVAIAAIVSLVGVGFNQVSYAAETQGNVTSGVRLQNFTFGQMSGSDGGAYFVLLDDGINKFKVPVYYRTEDDEPIFCVQHDIDPGYDSQYNALDNNNTGLTEKQMQGVLYILRQSKSAFGSSAPGISGSTGTIESVATQVAIWAYLYDVTGGVGPNTLVLEGSGGTSGICSNGDACRNVIKNFSSYDDTSLPPTIEVIPGLNLKIDKVVQAAINYNGVDNSLTVNKANDKFTKDGNYYKSSKITVSSGEDLQKYTVNLGTNSIGAKVVDASGKEKTSFDVANGDAKEFYIWVPADKVTTTKQTINIDVDGEFTNALSGKYYGISGKQTVVTVTEVPTTGSGNTRLEIVGSPDTAMSSVQTIYFIGLVVLLCGIGIIYANAKPVEEK